MDECDTAARVMDCGKNTNPDMFGDMVAAVDIAPVVCRFFTEKKEYFHFLKTVRCSTS